MQEITSEGVTLIKAVQDMKHGSRCEFRPAQVAKYMEYMSIEIQKSGQSSTTICSGCLISDDLDKRSRKNNIDLQHHIH